MTVLEKSKEALDITRLKLPSVPKVLSITAEAYEDWTGMPSLKVHVLIDDATDIENVTGQAWVELTSTIRQSLRDFGIDEFAYIEIAMPSELQDTGTEEEG